MKMHIYMCFESHFALMRSRSSGSGCWREKGVRAWWGSFAWLGVQVTQGDSGRTHGPKITGLTAIDKLDAGCMGTLARSSAGGMELVVVQHGHLDGGITYLWNNFDWYQGALCGTNDALDEDAPRPGKQRLMIAGSSD